ncbi:MAG: hypoxanthine-guanine phosphoribosyltransferase, partial [Gammaproteobacteria bacterium]|nr:hypoxanthine-guanine phosphoribosyltransferase [Gammaproteobacteria bacterium]
MTQPSSTPAQIARVLEHADLLHAPQQVEAAYDQMANQITETLGAENPLVLAVLVGGLVPAGALVPRFDFPLELDYIHATRYRGREHGRDLQWRATPHVPLAGRTVLIIDDILDEGFTLNAIVEYCEEQGAARVASAVLVNKVHDRKTMSRADFMGLEVADRYVFG